MELDTRTNAVLQNVVAQRNQAMDAVANLAGQIAVLTEELDVLRKKAHTNSVETQVDGKE